MHSDNKEINSLYSIMDLSGFVHDNGKAVNGFQKNLNLAVNGKKGELNSIRHELISAVLLLPLFNKNEANETGFARINTKEKVIKYFSCEIVDFYETFIDQAKEYNELLSYKIKNSENGKVSKQSIMAETFPILYELLSFSKWKENPLLQSLIFLVLSHHKLPNGEISSQSITSAGRRRAVEVDYFRPLMDPYFKPEPHKNIADFLRLSNNLPWDDDDWCRSVANAAERARAFEIEMKPIDPVKDDQWSSYLLFLSRPSLILADYKESAEKSICSIQDPKKITYANTIIENDVNLWADPLVTHQIKVGNTANWLFDNFAIRDDSVYKQGPSIKHVDKPLALKNPLTLKESSPFYWQNSISETLSKKEIGAGFFGVLMSKTGSGKTKAAPQIMMSLSKNSRFNIALGMRTLTLQTYNAYRSTLIGLKESQVSLMIGKGGLINQDVEDNCGTSNDFSNNDFDYNCIANEELGDHPLLSIIGKDKQKKMLMSPISVMTIDHIIQATDQSKGVHSTLLLEVMTSDLILDEIDDYSTEDLIPIAKLIYLCGFYGRKVIISSATSSVTMIESLQESYLDGYALYRKRYNAQEAVVAYMSHEAPYVNIGKSTLRKAMYAGFLNNLCEKTTSAIAKHQVEMINITPENYLQEILDGSLMLGKRYFTKCKESDINVSMGFVRFNNTQSSMDFADYVLNLPESNDVILKIQNYHSRMDVATRYTLESRMNKILNRDNPEAFLLQPEVQKAILQAKKSGAKNVVIIVSTTNIQETGRDHDYDWAICEPSSDKSLIQCAGRVWRHRRLLDLIYGPNIGLMSAPIKSFSTPDRCWSFPGIETYNRHDRHSKDYLVNKTPCFAIKMALKNIDINFIEQKEPEHLIRAESVLASDLINNKVSANPAISKIENYDDRRLASVEQSKMHYLIGRNESLKDMGLGSYLRRTDVMLTNRHGDIRQFRKQPDGSVDLNIGIAKPLDGFHESKWFAKDPFGQMVNFDIVSEEITDKNNRIFISIDRENALLSICREFKNNTDWFSEDICSVNLTSYGGENIYRYSTFYGFKSWVHRHNN